jgi:PhnB protein
MTDSWMPEGYTSITPYLCVDGAARAIDFYVEAFGATVVGRNDLPDGRVAHAEMQLGAGRFQLSDPAPDHNLRAATGDEVVDHSYVMYCPDVDATYAVAVAAGAKGYGEPETFVTGDRYALVLDPFGHRWALMTRVEDVDPVEAARRVDEWLAANEV